MLRGYRRFIVTAVGCIVGSGVLWWQFSPRQPQLPVYQKPEEQSTAYQAGGANCRPDVLARLTGKDAASEGNRCAEATEEHRLKADDLIQQTRAADAAQSSAWTTFEATRVALWGLIGGLLTLVAAIFAAYYARRAYLQSAHSFEMAARPFVFLEKLETSPLGDGLFKIEAHFRNSGQTPAIKVRLFTYWEIVDLRIDQSTPTFADDALNLPNIPPNFMRKGMLNIPLTQEQSKAISEYRSEMWLHFEIHFDSRFRKDKIVSESRRSTGSDWENGTWFISRGPAATTTPLLAAQNESHVEGERTANDDKRNDQGD